MSKNTVFDNSGNVKTAVDAVGNSAAYTYDSLDRLLSANYTGATAGIANVGITYSYDTGPGALSRLSQTTDPSGSTQWQYDSQGRLTGKSQTVGAQTLSLGYTYDDAVTIDTNGDGAADSSSGRLASVTYPSQLTVSYTYDSAGRTKTLSIDTTNDGNANPQTVIDSITYYPWGGIKTYRLPAVAGQPTVVRYQNTDGRTTQYTQYNPADVANGNERKWLGYDRLGNVTQLGEIVRATSAVSVLQNYGYDKLNRLTGFTTADGTVSQSYSYDANGNRSNKTVGGVATTYTRTASATGSPASAPPPTATTTAATSAPSATAPPPTATTAATAWPPTPPPTAPSTTTPPTPSASASPKPAPPCPPAAASTPTTRPAT